jgi:hypothetical protein
LLTVVDDFRLGLDEACKLAAMQHLESHDLRVERAASEVAVVVDLLAVGRKGAVGEGIASEVEPVAEQRRAL